MVVKEWEVTCCNETISFRSKYEATSGIISDGRSLRFVLWSGCLFMVTRKSSQLAELYHKEREQSVFSARFNRVQ